MYRFVKELFDYRRRLPERADLQLSLTDVLTLSRVHWHGKELNVPDWSDHSHSIAFTIATQERWFHLIFNAYWEPIKFELPKVPITFSPWKRMIDTDLPSPDDIGPGVALDDITTYQAQPRSTIILRAEHLSSLQLPSLPAFRAASDAGTVRS